MHRSTLKPARPMAVDVVMTTFNHERFVARAIESVVAQRTSFPVRLLVGEDRSTDRTREVVGAMARRYPDRVVPLLRAGNLGATRNFADLLARCSARYVALLEGDDYWTSPVKLQKQADFLERHPDCALCFHDVTVFPEEASFATYRSRPPTPGGITGLRDLLRGNYIHTCSVMFRAGLVRLLPPWYFPLLIDDWTFFALNAEHGDIGHLDEVMAAYRVHAGGVWSGQNRPGQQLCRLQAYDAVNAHFRYRYDAIVRGVTARCCYDVATGLEKDGDFTRAKHYALQSLRRRPHGTLSTRLQLLRLLFRGQSPRLYEAARHLKRSLHARCTRRSTPVNVAPRGTAPEVQP